MSVKHLQCCFIIVELWFSIVQFWFSIVQCWFPLFHGFPLTNTMWVFQWPMLVLHFPKSVFHCPMLVFSFLMLVFHCPMLVFFIIQCWFDIVYIILYEWFPRYRQEKTYQENPFLEASHINKLQSASLLLLQNSPIGFNGAACDNDNNNK